MMVAPCAGPSQLAVSDGRSPPVFHLVGVVTSLNVQTVVTIALTGLTRQARLGFSQMFNGVDQSCQLSGDEGYGSSS